MKDDDDDARRARRAFIREHHPDRGGDPQHFIAELARLSSLLKPEDGDIRVVMRPTPSVRERLTAASRRVLRRRAGPPRVQ